TRAPTTSSGRRTREARRASWNWPRPISRLAHYDRSIVVDVGECRAGHHQAAGLLEEPIAVVLVEQGLRARDLRELGKPHRAGIVLRAVDAVGVRGDGR